MATAEPLNVKNPELLICQTRPFGLNEQYNNVGTSFGHVLTECFAYSTHII